MSSHHRDAAHKAWHGAPQDWIVILAEQCDLQGQANVAKRIGMSTSTINEVVRNKYTGRVDNVAAKVRGAFMGATVDCPVLGELATDVCLKNQKRPFSAANPIRVSLHRACPTCPNFRRQPKPDSKPEEK